MRRRHQLRPDTFPFLAVLLCTMGSLILVLMVFDRKARLAARARAEAAWRREEEDEANKAALLAAAEEERYQARQRRQREQLNRLASEERRLNIDHDRVRARLAAVLRALEDPADGLRVQKKQVAARTAQARESFLLRQTELTKVTRAAEGLRSQREQLTAELLALEDGLRRLRAQRQREQQTWSVVPYVGRRGQNVRPHYVECTAEGLIFHPDRRSLSGIYLAPETIRAEVRKRTERPARNGPQPYWMLLVRPDGIGTYYVFLSAVKALDLSYGYEFVDPDWVLDFPDPSRAPRPPTPVVTVKPPPRPRRPVGVIARGASQGQGRGSRLPSTSPITVASASGGGAPRGPGGPGGVPGTTLPTAATGGGDGPPGPPGAPGGSAAGGSPGTGAGGGSPGSGWPGNSSSGGGLSGNRYAGGGLPGQGEPGGSPGGGGEGTSPGRGTGAGKTATPQSLLPGNAGVDGGGNPSPSSMFPADPSADTSACPPAGGPGVGGEGTGTGAGTGPGDGDGTGPGSGNAAGGVSGAGSPAARLLPPRPPSLPALFPSPGGGQGNGTGGATPPGAEGGTGAASSAGGGAGNGGGQGTGGAGSRGSSPGAGAGAAGAAVGPQDGSGGPPDPLGGRPGTPGSQQGGVYGPGGTGQRRGSGSAPDEGDPRPPGPLPPDKAVAEGLPRLTAGAAPGGEPAGDGDGMRSPHANGLPTPPPDTNKPRRPRPRALRPAAPYGDEEWVLVVDCTAKGVRLSPSQLNILLQELARGHGGDALLARTVATMIERRRAVQEPAAPPFRPQIRFVIHRDGLRSFHAALTALENIRVPKRTVMLDE